MSLQMLDNTPHAHKQTRKDIKKVIGNFCQYISVANLTRYRRARRLRTGAHVISG
jgi:hypothetical protein